MYHLYSVINHCREVDAVISTIAVGLGTQKLGIGIGILKLYIYSGVQEVSSVVPSTESSTNPSAQSDPRRSVIPHRAT